MGTPTVRTSPAAMMVMVALGVLAAVLLVWLADVYLAGVFHHLTGALTSSQQSAPQHISGT